MLIAKAALRSCVRKQWYYNSETKSQTWVVPDEIKKLDEISAAAKAANDARGT